MVCTSPFTNEQVPEFECLNYGLNSFVLDSSDPLAAFQVVGMFKELVVQRGGSVKKATTFSVEADFQARKNEGVTATFRVFRTSGGLLVGSYCLEGPHEQPKVSLADKVFTTLSQYILRPFHGEEDEEDSSDSFDYLADFAEFNDDKPVTVGDILSCN